MHRLRTHNFCCLSFGMFLMFCVDRSSSALSRQRIENFTRLSENIIAHAPIKETAVIAMFPLPSENQLTERDIYSRETMSNTEDWPEESLEPHGKEKTASGLTILSSMAATSTTTTTTLNPVPKCLENSYGVVLEAGRGEQCGVLVSSARCDPATTTTSFTLVPNDDGTGGGNDLDYRVVEGGAVEVLVVEEAAGEYTLRCTDLSNHSTPTGKHVYVGFRPLDVEDWGCVSYNWRVLECRWSLPYNPAQGHNERYRPYLRNHTLTTLCVCEGLECTYQSASCPVSCCAWPSDTYYNGQEQILYMDFLVRNVLGGELDYCYPHVIHHWAVVVPAPPEEVRVEVSVGREVEVDWRTPEALWHFPPCLTYSLHYRLSASACLEEDCPWTLVGEGMCCARSCEARVEVDYWWISYEVRVRLRSAAAEVEVEEEEEWWSDWQPVTFTTPPAVPDSGPTLGPGSYQVSQAGDPKRRDLTLSWRPLPPLLHNGPNFTYAATATATSSVTQNLQQGEKSVTADITGDTYATFLNLSSSLAYRVEVAAVNSEGRSEVSVVTVGAAPSLPLPPSLPVVVIYTQQQRQQQQHHQQQQQQQQQIQLYELRWSRVEEGVAAARYTVYLCTDDQESPQPCKGQLYWTAAGNVTAVNVTLEDFLVGAARQLRFAVSGEGESGESSGLAWDTCSTPRPYTPTRRPPTPHKPIVEEDVTRVPWTAECQDWAGVVEGVQAIYCPDHHNDTDDCQGEVEKVEGEVWSGEVELVDLSAGVEYTVWLRLVYRAGPSLLSTPSTFTTTASRKVSREMVAGVVLVSVLLVVTLTWVLIRSFRKVRAFQCRLTSPIFLPEGLQAPKQAGSDDHEQLKMPS